MVGNTWVVWHIVPWINNLLVHVDGVDVASWEEFHVGNSATLFPYNQAWWNGPLFWFITKSWLSQGIFIHSNIWSMYNFILSPWSSPQRSLFRNTYLQIHKLPKKKIVGRRHASRSRYCIYFGGSYDCATVLPELMCDDPWMRQSIIRGVH